MVATLLSERIHGNRKPMWQTLGGTSFGEGDQLTAMEAFDRGNMLYGFHLTDLYAQLPHGERILLEGEKAVMREPTVFDPRWRMLNKVKPNYGLIQHSDIARVLDQSGIAKQWPIETLGALGKGERMFATFTTTPYDVKGQQVNRYFLMSDDKSGDGGLTIGIVHIRVVCQNTLTAAIKGASVKVSFQHHQNVLRDMDAYAKIVAQLEAAQTGVTGAFAALADKRITDEQAKLIAGAAYPDPAPPQKVALLEQYAATNGLAKVDPATILQWQEAAEIHEQRRERAAAYRLEVMDRYQIMNEQYQATAETAWNAYNAAVEVLDCQLSRGENAGIDVLWGHRAAARLEAYQVAASC